MFSSIPNPWNLIYSTTTNKFSFQYTANDYLTGTFILSDDTNSIFPILGFKTGVQYMSSLTTAYYPVNGVLVGTTTNILQAPYPFNFAGLSRINIKSSTLNIRNLDSSKKSLNRTIASIPVNSNNSSGYIFYNNLTNYKSILNNKELSSICIEIKDDDYNYIDFQNANWTMTLQIDCVNEIIENLDDLNDVYSNAKTEDD